MSDLNHIADELRLHTIIAEQNEKIAALEREVEPVARMCPNDPDSASAFSWKPTKCNCGTERVPVGIIPKEQSKADDSGSNPRRGGVR